MSKKEVDPCKVIRRFCEDIQSFKAPVFVGVDPGSSGAVGLRCKSRYAVVDIPTIKVGRGKGKSKTAFNLPAIVRMFVPLRSFVVKGGTVHAVVEEAQVGIPGKGNSAYNGFRVGAGFGMWPLFLTAMGFTLEENARPHLWKKKMGLSGKDKETSRHKALGMFPNAPLLRKKDHDRAEALLLAEFLKRIRYDD